MNTIMLASMIWQPGIKRERNKKMTILAVNQLKKEIGQIKSVVWQRFERKMDVYTRLRHSHSSVQCSRCNCGEKGCTGWAWSDDRATAIDPGAVYSHTETYDVWVNNAGEEFHRSPDERIADLESRIAYLERKAMGNQAAYLGPESLRALKRGQND